MDLKKNITEIIGNTPLVRINNLFQKTEVEIYAKLEGQNPLGSLKERIAYSMVEGAIRSGSLTKNRVILESSSGNTGIGLAMVGAAMGYKVCITMQKKVSVERSQILKALGAEVILVDGGSDDAWDMADKLYQEHPEKYVRLSQYSNPDNVRAHYEKTGIEIWEQTGGKVTHLIAGLGTTGTIVGAGKRLKELNPKIRVIAVEPQKKHNQQGLRNMEESRVPGLYDRSVVNETLIATDQDAYHWTRMLSKCEGIFAGISSGSVIWAAIEIAKKIDIGFIVAILPDRGEKYLSTDLYPL